ncbi:hypothetical protein AB1Y20_011727 [Prymnesium parvum]|uniref:Uncharacterized protein n=1 Tax=Prymnesium parvum TaxID=97485 RepID=A0AB34IH62_PRYPA
MASVEMVNVIAGHAERAGATASHARQTKQYVTEAVAEAILRETGATTCEVRDLRAVLRRCLHRAVREDEHRALLGALGAGAVDVSRDADGGGGLMTSGEIGHASAAAAPPKQIGGSAKPLDADTLGAAVFGLLADGGALHGARVLRRSDFLFSLHHGGSTRAQVFATLGAWILPFVVANAALLLCSIVLLVFASIEMASVNIFSESPFIATIASCLIVVSLLALTGSYFLRRDLASDEDGKETRSQRLVEVSFWVLFTLNILLFVLGVAILSNEPLAAQLSEQAAYYPDKFIELAEKLQINTTAGADAVAAGQRVVNLVRFGEGITALVLCAVMCAVMVPAVKIITLYEFVQGLLRYLGGLYLVLSLSLLFFGAAGQQLYELHSTRVPLDDGFRTSVLVATVALMTLGALIAPVACVGFVATQQESTTLLRYVEYATYPLALLIAAFSVLAFVAGTSPLDGTHHHLCTPPPNCFAQFGSSKWFASLAPGVSCTKYYGQGASLSNGSLIAGTERGLSPGVGEVIACFNQSDAVYAWEFNLESSGCGVLNNYGCLNANGCCHAMKAAGQTYLVVCGIFALVTAFGLIVGLFGARYQRACLERIDAAQDELRLESGKETANEGLTKEGQEKAKTGRLEARRSRGVPSSTLQPPLPFAQTELAAGATTQKGTQMRYLSVVAGLLCAILIAFCAAAPVVIANSFKSYESNGDAAAEGNCTLNATVPSTGALLRAAATTVATKEAAVNRTVADDTYRETLAALTQQFLALQPAPPPTAAPCCSASVPGLASSHPRL